MQRHVSQCVEKMSVSTQLVDKAPRSATEIEFLCPSSTQLKSRHLCCNDHCRKNKLDFNRNYGTLCCTEFTAIVPYAGNYRVLACMLLI